MTDNQIICNNNFHQNDNEPSIIITEQPKARGLRFRYKCEGRSAGSVPGENSTNEKKSYPTIRISNFNGPSAIVVVSCVTKDPPFYPHPHNLVGQDCRDGVCTVKVKNPQMEISFPNIGIQCCKRHDITENLKQRENIRVDPFGHGFQDAGNNIDLNAVRFCFQVFLPDDNKKFTKIVQPVVSKPIIDKKSVHDLVICRLSRNSGSARGGDEVFLLCEKINKDDIKVKFYQCYQEDVWEAYGEFDSNDVHRQFAIVFKTPPFRDPNIKEMVKVFIQLVRPSDDEAGDPRPFHYYPDEDDPYSVNKKRKRKDLKQTGLYPAHPYPSLPLTVLNENDNENLYSMNDKESVKNKIKKKVNDSIQKKEIKNEKCQLQEIDESSFQDQNYLQAVLHQQNQHLIQFNFNQIQSQITMETDNNNNKYLEVGAHESVVGDNVKQENYQNQ